MSKRATHGNSQAKGDPLARMHRVRRNRASLCASTALQAATLVVLAGPAFAQLAPSARPSGGQVAAGSASIATSGATTQINQSSETAVINWQSYNVGSGQTVAYAQPNAQAFTLNRVISSNPSQIAGHIVANGRIAIVNQSGVIFLNGSTVDTSGLVVSAANISNADFMAGRLVFSQAPNPGAVVSNAGNITIKNAGLAALVAPQVVNSGTINANLGTVILAGAATHTIDTYGDGLISINVTGEVTSVNIGGQSVPALVTNIGTILTPGGHIVLTAQAADGLVQTLVNAGGVIAAPSAAGQTGHVLVNGIGGDIEIEGDVSASGNAAGTSGGAVTINSDHNVTVTAGAMVDASGATGGGAISIGANAASTTIASGATLRANATGAGNGGQITVAAAKSLTVQGSLAARGGPGGGNGGQINIDGAGLLLAGSLDASAPHGRAGAASVLTSGNVIVTNNCGGLPLCITYAAFFSSTGGYASTLDVNDGSIKFEGTGATSPQAVTLTTTLDSANPGNSGDINFAAGTAISAPSFSINAAGNLAVGGALTATAGGFSLTAGGYITEVTTSGGNPPAETGSLSGGTLIIGGASKVTLGGQNSITTLGSVSSAGSFSFTDDTGLTVTAPLTATGDVVLDLTDGGFLTVDANISGANVTANVYDGITVGTGATISTAAGGLLALTTDFGDLSFGGTLTSTNVSLTAYNGSVFETVGGAVQAGTLTALATFQTDNARQAREEEDPYDILLTTSGNTIATIAGLNAYGTVDLTDTASAALVRNGTISGANVTLTLTGNTLTQGINSLITSLGTVSVDAELLAQDSGATLEATTGFSTTGAVSQAGALINVSDGNASTGAGLSQTATSRLIASDVTIGSEIDGTLSQTGASLIEATGPGGVTIGLTGNASQDATSLILASAGTITINSIAGALNLGGIISAPGEGGAILLETSSTISQSETGTGSATGSLLASSLAVSAGGNVNLSTTSGAESGNQIAALTSASTPGNFVLVDGAALSITGPLAGANVQIVTPALVTSGAISATGGTIALAADSFVFGAALTASAVNLGLLQAGAFTVGPQATVDAASLAQVNAGQLVLGSANGTATGTTLTSAGSSWGTATNGQVSTLTVLQAISTGATLGLFSAGAIDAGTAQITAAGVFGAGGGAITLTDAANRFGVIGAQGLVTTAGAIGITDTSSLALLADATLSAPSGITVALGNGIFNQEVGSNVASTMGGISVTGTLIQNSATLSAAGPVAVTGGLFQSGSTLTANGASVTIGGAIDQAASVINAISGSVNASLTDGVNQDAQSAITASDAINLTTSGGGLYLGGKLSAFTTITLSAAGTITQAAQSGGDGGASLPTPTGTLTAPTLTATAGGDLLLDGAANTILNLTSATAGGVVSLTDHAALTELAAGTIAGTDVTLTLSDGLTQTATSAIISTGDIGVTSTAGTLYLGGVVSATGAVSLQATNGGVTQAGGSGAALTGTLTAGTLSAIAGNGDVNLSTSAANLVGSLATATATGTLAITDGLGLTATADDTISGAQGITLTLGGAGLTQLAGSAISSAHGAILLTAASLTQESGATLAGASGLTVTGDVTQQGGNVLAAGSGAASIGGTLSQGAGSRLTAGQGVTIGGALTQDAATLTSAGGTVTLDGSVAQTAASLISGNTILIGQGTAVGSFSQAGSAIHAGTGGISVSLTGDLSQDYASTLTSLGAIRLSSSAGGLYIGGGVVAPGQAVSLAAPNGNIEQLTQSEDVNTGSLVAGVLTASAGTNGSGAYDLLLNGLGGNQITTVTNATATSVVSISDLGNLTLAQGGSITGGTVTLGLPNGTLTLGQNAQISAEAGGGFLILNSTQVIQEDASVITASSGLATITGNLTQIGGTLTAGGPISIGGTLTQQAGGSSPPPSAARPGGTGGTPSEVESGGTVTVGGAVSQSGAAVISAAGAASLGGDVTQSDSLIEANGITIAGSLNQSLSQVYSETPGPAQDAPALLVGGSLTQDNSTVQSAGGVSVNGTTAQTAGSFITAGTSASFGASVSQDNSVILGGSDITMAGGLTQANGSETTASGGSVSITIAGPLNQNGSSLTATGAISIGGTVTQTNASLISTTGGDISIGGGAHQSAASTIITTGGGITIGGDTTQTSSAITASGDIDFSGTQNPGAGVVAQSFGTITAGGGITLTNGLAQSNSTLSAGTNITASGIIAQTNASTISAVGTIGFAGQVNQTASVIMAQDVTLSGNLNQTAQSEISVGDGFTAFSLANVTQTGGSEITAGAGGVTIGGTVNQNASFITASGAINLASSNVTSIPAVEVAQSNGSAVISTGGTIFVLGGFQQSDSKLIAAGNIAMLATNLSQNAGTIAAGGALTLDGRLDGAVTQTNGSSISAPGGITLTLQNGFSQDASSTLLSGGNVTITAGGGIGFAGLIQAGTLTAQGAYSGSTVLNASGGSIEGAGGTLLTGDLTANAAGDISFNSGANVFGTIVAADGLGGLTAGGSLTLDDPNALVLTDATIRAGGTLILQTPSLTEINGTIATGGSFNLQTGTITQQGGVISAGGVLSITTTALAQNSGALISGDGGVNLTLSADGVALSQDASSQIASGGGAIAISTPGTVALAGTLSAQKIAIGDFTPGGNADGPADVILTATTFTTGNGTADGLGQTNVPAPLDSTQASAGLFITAANITQTGRSTINGIGPGGTASLQFALTGSGGAITLDPSQGLYAPSTQLLLNLQSTGTITGHIDVAGLNVYYGSGGPGAGTFAKLTGEVDGLGGFPAAGVSVAHPQEVAADQINGCTIGASSCVLLSPVVVPLFTLVTDIDITQPRKRDDDDDLILPNVGEQDY